MSNANQTKTKITSIIIKAKPDPTIHGTIAKLKVIIPAKRTRINNRRSMIQNFFMFIMF